MSVHHESKKSQSRTLRDSKRCPQWRMSERIPSVARLPLDCLPSQRPQQNNEATIVSKCRGQDLRTAYRPVHEHKTSTIVMKCTSKCMGDEALQITLQCHPQASQEKHSVLPPHFSLVLHSVKTVARSRATGKICRTGWKMFCNALTKRLLRWSQVCMR